MKRLQLALICTCIFGIPCVKADCQFGSNRNEGSAETSLRGQFVDLDNPLTCSGTIVAWHFCFYTDNVVNVQEQVLYTARFRVYRSVAANQLQRVHDVQRGLPLSMLEGREVLFLCFDDVLEQDQYLDVLEGDILAVFIPVIFPPLLLVGTNTQGRVYRDIRSTGAPFRDLTLPISGLMMLQNYTIHLYADVVSTTQINRIGPGAPISMVISAMLPFTTTSVSPTPTHTLYGTLSSHNNMSSTTFQTTPAQPTNAFSEVGSTRLDTVKIVAIVIAGVLSLTVLILITMILIILLKRQGKSVKEKQHNNNLSLDNFFYEQPNNDHHDGRIIIEHHRVPPVPPVPQAILSGKPQFIDKYGYHVIEPSIPKSSEEFRRTEVLKYEQATAEVFHIYENAVHPSSADVTLHMRKVVTSLERTTAIPYCVPASEEEEIYQQLSQQNLLIIPPQKIQIIEHLGSGQFSEVEKAQWISDNGRTEVAVKTLHNDATGRSKIRCLQEAAMMAQFHHPNVVTLHGIIRESHKISLVMEFLVNGDLGQYLLRMRQRYDDPRDIAESNTAKYLLSYSQQVALGMLYLSDKGFVHRDLAARNVFVSDRDICKVGDFGMSRDLADTKYYVSEGGTIPIKWTAPEAVYYHKYSTVTDIWSFGCLLYEIWSMGHKPFDDTFDADVLRKLSTGYRLPPPPGCPYDIYKLMIKCWNRSPDSRPGFQDILISLLGDEQQVLAIPFDDASTYHLASCLGANLEAGYKMYPYLQSLYTSANASAFHSPMYEPRAGTCPNKHGMVYIKEKASSLKHIQEPKSKHWNMASAILDPQEGPCITHENGYASVTDRIENNTRRSPEYNSNRTPLLQPFSQSTGHQVCHTW